MIQGRFSVMEAAVGFGYGGDIRVWRRGERVFSDIVRSGSVVVRKFCGSRSAEIGAYRFLGSPLVTADGILSEFGARTALACKGRVIVAAQDTSEINFSGADSGRTGLGLGGDGRSLGFFVHPLVAVDAADEAVLGIAGARIWTRGMEKTQAQRSRPLEDKESQCWLEAVETAADVLKEAARVIVVGDRESDIYELFAHRAPSVELVVRSRCDRRLCGGNEEEAGVKPMLYAAGAAFEPAGEMAVKVASKGIGDKGRTAKVSVSFGRVSLSRPNNVRAGTAAANVGLTLIVAKETGAPASGDGLLWRLLTTLPVSTFEQAAEAIGFYRLRWRIEEVFRVLKRDGLALERTQIESSSRLFNLAAMALGAAARIIQLTDARDKSSRPASDVLGEHLFDPADEISAALEGKTERQKNPHPKGSLPWLSWITARLGGWNCYYKPPGPKTMADGWRRLAAMLEGYQIAMAKSDV
jgi:Transposase DDE domain